MANWPPKPGAAGAASTLPVGRVVKFTENGPESSEAPLFQEKTDASESASPFAIVQEPAGAPAIEALDGLDESEGFTVGELASLAPANTVRRHALPPDQEIALPLDLLRASMNAGQPAILLSQLHTACPDLFFAPRNEDEDIVIALPESKVARLLENAPQQPTARSMSPFEAAPSVKLPEPKEPVHRDLARDSAEAPSWQAAPTRSPLIPLSKLPETQLPSRTRFPFTRQGSDKMDGPSMPPLTDMEDTPEAALPSPPPASITPVALPPRGSSEPSATDTNMALPATSPFSVAGPGAAPAFASINPFESHADTPENGTPPAKAAWPRRFESPFAIVSPGEVPAVIESPFAARPAVEAATDPVPEPAAESADAVEPAATAPAPTVISLRLSELLKSLPPASLGFAPERVPAAVRVEVPVEPLLAQLATGRVTMPLAEVIEKIDSRYQPAFQKTKPGLSVVVPMREIFDNLPEITSEAPESVPVEDIFSTPFSVKAKEDAHLDVFEPDAAASPVLPPVSFVEVETPIEPEPVAAVEAPVWADLPVQPTAEMPLPQPAEDAVAEALSPALAEPFVIVPEPPAAVAATPVLPPLLPPALPVLEEPAPVSAAPVLDAAPPLPVPSPATAAEPVTNPFALAPRQNLAGALSDFGLTSPFDEDPVPLESLRDDPALQTPPALEPAVSVAQPGQPPEAASRPVVPSGIPFSFGTPPRAATPPPVVQPPPVPPETPLVPPVSQDQAMPVATIAAPEPAAPPPIVAVAEVRAAEAVEAAEIAEEATPAAPPVFSFGTPGLTAFAPTESAETAPVVIPVLENGVMPLASPFAPFAEDAEAPVARHDEPNETPAAPAAPAGKERVVCALVADILRPLIAAKTPESKPAAFTPASVAEDAPPGESAAEAPAFDFRAPFSFAQETAPAEIAIATETPAAEPLNDAPAPEAPAETLAPVAVAAPDLTEEKAETEAASESPSAIEDLSFGYVDDPVQLALRAIFSTDQAMSAEDVAHRTAEFPGLRACMVLSSQGAVPGGVSADPGEDVRHFQERAGGLFEKTASLVRELDPSAREQTFTLRTAKGVISFFAVGDVCLAALHGEPNFQPGVREKLTLVSRALADMLGA